MPRVTFQRRDRSEEIESGGSLLRAAETAGVPLASSCRGRGVCDACRVSVVVGEENLSAPSAREETAPLEPRERLACQAYVRGPVTITTAYW